MSDPDRVVVRCPSCSQKYRVSRASVGQRGRCKSCHAVFVIAAHEAVDDDTIMGWITDEDPSSQSVMGSTGMFEAGVGGRVASRANGGEAARTAAAETAGLGVRLKRIDGDGAHFEFPAAALELDALRNAFPRKCVGCGVRTGLHVHLIYWPERMTAHDASHWATRMAARAGKLDAFVHPATRDLLAQLPRTRHAAKPFTLPFPAFACEHCDVARHVITHVVTRGQEELCRLTLVFLPVAVSFFRNAGGRDTPEYRRLVDERNRRHDAWQALDAETRQRLTLWFQPEAGERFVAFFGDPELAACESGKAGLVLTTRRLVFKRYAAQRAYPLDQPGRVEVVEKGGRSMVHLYEEGQPPAAIALDHPTAEKLLSGLRKVNCQWTLGGR